MRVFICALWSPAGKGLTSWLSFLVSNPIGQSVASPAADQGVTNSIPAWPHTFMEIDNEIISTVILLPLIQEGFLSVTYQNMDTKYWLTA